MLPPAPQSHKVIPKKTYRSPSYYRRQVRRKAERENRSDSLEESSLADKAKEEETAEEAISSVDDNEMDDSVLIEEEEIAEEADTCVDDEVDECALISQDYSVTDKMELDENEETVEMLSKPSVDVSLELDSIVRQSQENRDRWEKFNAFPP